MIQTGTSEREYQRALVAAIKSEIGGRGWSRKHLAELSGITEQQMERIFNLKRDMSVAQLDAIAGALGVEPDDLAMAARRWRDPHVTTNTIGQSGTDPRTLIRELLDNPDKDTELLDRLAEAAQHLGDKSARAKRLAQEIRNTRRDELAHALASLPPAEQRAAGES
jgi:transcriptional regulator with XRE-family HTH domain